jgi:hypothetical protein
MMTWTYQTEHYSMDFRIILPGDVQPTRQ